MTTAEQLEHIIRFWQDHLHAEPLDFTALRDAVKTAEAVNAMPKGWALENTMGDQDEWIAQYEDRRPFDGRIGVGPTAIRALEDVKKWE